jgi:hypothetical protein
MKKIYFNYTDKIQVWHKNKCIKKSDIDKGWEYSDIVKLVVRGIGNIVVFVRLMYYALGIKIL